MCRERVLRVQLSALRFAVNHTFHQLVASHWQFPQLDYVFHSVILVIMSVRICDFIEKIMLVSHHSKS